MLEISRCGSGNLGTTLKEETSDFAARSGNVGTTLNEGTSDSAVQRLLLEDSGGGEI